MKIKTLMAKFCRPTCIAHLAISAYEIPDASPSFVLTILAIVSSSISICFTLYNAQYKSIFVLPSISGMFKYLQTSIAKAKCLRRTKRFIITAGVNAFILGKY